MLLKKLLMADVVELAGFVLQLQMHYEENPLTVTFQASFRDIRVGSISFLEALSKVCERNTGTCTQNSAPRRVPSKGTILLLSCRKVLPPAQSGPQSACMCN